MTDEQIAYVQKGYEKDGMIAYGFVFENRTFIGRYPNAPLFLTHIPTKWLTLYWLVGPIENAVTILIPC